MENRLGQEIGRGGFGVVRVLNDASGKVVKISNREGSGCRKWSDEYSKLESIKEKLSANSIYRKLEMVRILFPDSYSEEGNNCYMTLPRIFPAIETETMATIHPLFGNPGSYRSLTPGRGLYIGLSEIETLLTEEQMRQAVMELGIVMALLHFVARNDAFDIEIFLGRSQEDGSDLKLYIADFDLTESIESFDVNTIENRMYWSLEAISYFPNRDSNNDLYELFREAYMGTATLTTGAKGQQVAEELFGMYV